MLDSMAVMERPDRRECEDVAITVTDGADGIILSDAAACGRFGMEAVQTIGRCCAEAERTIDHKAVLTDLKKMTPRDAVSDDGLSASAISAVLNMDLELIVVVSKTGKLPRLISKYRPSVPVLTFCESDVILRQLSVIRGIIAQK